MTDEERLAEIRWTQETGHPHGCGDNADGPSCAQELNGTCLRATCEYFRVCHLNRERSEP